MPARQFIMGLPGFKIIEFKQDRFFLEIFVKYEGERRCIHCGSVDLRTKDSF